MAQELEGVDCVLHVKVDPKDVDSAKRLFVSIVDNATVKQGFDAMERGLGAVSHTAEKGLKAIQGLNGITARGFNELTSAVNGLISRMEELNKKSAESTEQSRRAVTQAASEVKEQFDGIDHLMRQGAGYVGGYFALDFLNGQLENVKAIRSEFQSIQYSLKILLGSEEKATAMFEDIKKFAIDTPMDMKGIASAAQLMMGFGIESNEVMKDLRALGDVAMGDSNRFQHLALAFAQMSAAGKLMGQDLLQMINAGFNPLQQMAKTTGKTIGELKEEMSAGLLTADKVKQAFWDAASEGGKYYGMMELQATTIRGQQEKLKDALDAMYNTLGEYLEGYIIDFIKFEGELVENWKEVIKILGELIVAYGVYRTVLITHTTLTRASAVAERALAMAKMEVTAKTKLATTAQVLYNQAANGLKGALNMVTSLINPWTLLAVAIGGAVAGIVHFATKETELDKATKQLNDITAEYTTKVQKEQKEVDRLFGTLSALKDGTDKYKQTKATIMDEYGKYLKNLDKEVQTLNNIEEAYKAITRAIRDKWKTQALDKAQSAFNEQTELRQKDLLGEVFQGVDETGINRMFRNGNKWSARDRARIKETASNLFNEYVAELEEYSRLFDVDNNGETAYSIIEQEVVNKFLLGDQRFDEFQNYSGVSRNILREKFKEYYETWKAQRQALTEAKVMFQTEGDVFTEDEGKEDTKKKTKPQTEDPNKKALEEFKKTIQERIKVGKEIVSLQGQYKAETKRIAEAFGMNETGKDLSRINATDNLNYNLSMLLSKNPKFTETDKANIDRYYSEVSDYTFDEAKTALMENTAKLTQLEADLKKAEAGKSSKKKGSDNTAALNQTKESLELWQKKQEEYVKLSIQQQALQDIVNQGMNTDKFKEKIEAYSQFAQDYANILANSRAKLEEYQREYNKASSAEDQNRIAKLIERERSEAGFATEMLKQEFSQQYSEAVPEEIMAYISEFLGKTTKWTIDKINAEILVKNAELHRLERQAEITGQDLSEEIATIKAEIATLESSKNEASPDNGWLAKAQNEVGKLAKAFNDLGNAISGSSGEALKTLASTMDISMNLANEIVSFTKICSQLITKTATGAVAALKTIEAASLILEIISLVVQLGLVISNVFKDDSLEKFQEEIKELRKELRDFLHELENQRVLESSNNLFGTDSWGNLTNQIGIANKAYSKFKETQADVIKNAETMGKLNKSGASIFGFSNFGDKGTFDTLIGQYNTLGETIANFKVKVSHKTWLRKEQSMTLKDAVPELFDSNGDVNMDALTKFIGSDAFEKLSEDNQEYLENLSKDWNEYKEALKGAEDEMAGWFSGVGNQIGDIFVEAFKTGKNALADFENAWDQAMENMVNSLMYSTFLQPIFDRAQEAIKETGFLENPDEANQKAVMDILQGVVSETQSSEDFYNKMMQWYKENYGLYDGGSDRQALTGGIANVTQDTAEEMNGRLTQIQSHTFAINENVLALRNFGAQQLEILQGIKGDTSRLEVIQSEITAVKASVSDIQIYGIKLKK